MTVVEVLRSPIQACLHHNMDSDGDSEQPAWMLEAFHRDYNLPDFEVTHYFKQAQAEVFGVKVGQNVLIASVVESAIISYFVEPGATSLLDLHMTD